MSYTELEAKIIYILIAHPKHGPLAHHAYLSGTYQDTVGSLLPTIPYDAPETRRCYQYDEFRFYYLVNAHKTAFLCLTDASFSKLQAFRFLQDVRLIFETEVDERRELNQDGMEPLPEYALNRRLKSFLKEKLSYYNDNPEADKIKLASQQIEEVKVEMLKNIDKALDIGKKIDVLAEETSHMDEGSRLLRRNARTMRNRVIRNNICIVALISFSICVAIFILVAYFCGVKCVEWMIPNRGKDNNSPVPTPTPGNGTNIVEEFRPVLAVG
uniref:V-SNARE coiled-coil homology domain-containing protein n=1 Tax=Percolomonas cosmopolitus TaxID=63605 RepID=A0A7S1PJ82_9EUKA